MYVSTNFTYEVIERLMNTQVYHIRKLTNTIQLYTAAVATKEYVKSFLCERENLHSVDIVFNRINFNSGQ